MIGGHAVALPTLRTVPSFPCLTFGVHSTHIAPDIASLIQATSVVRCENAKLYPPSLRAQRSNPPLHLPRDGLLRGACHRAALRADPLARNDDDGPQHDNLHRTNTIVALSQLKNTSRATRRRTAVEIATCPRQCADALRSNFCRHTHRMVNPQANVFTSAQTSLADGSLRAHSRPLPQRCVTMPVRSVRYRARRGLYECSTLGDKI